MHKVPKVNLLDTTVEPTDEELHALMAAVRDKVVARHRAWVDQATPEQVAELRARPRHPPRSQTHAAAAPAPFMSLAGGW